MPTDTGLGRAILKNEQPYHRIGQPHAEGLQVRAGDVAMVRDFLATVTLDDLAATRSNPWAPDHQNSVLACLHVILQEEWEHHRYAVRDLAAIEAKSLTGT